MGGEEGTSASACAARAGLPPRGRGRETFASASAPHRWITPAWAGKSCDVVRNVPYVQDYPRVGGEERSVRGLGCCASGLPPRGRGRGRVLLPFLVDPRITPAWAGKSNRQIEISEYFKDYPRVGGEE